MEKTTLDKIVETADVGIIQLLHSLGEQQNKILDALGSVADLFQGGATLTGFIRKAWEKVRSAFRTIQQIVDAAPLNQLRCQLKDLLNALSIRNGLERIFQISKLRSEITGLRVSATISPADMDARRTIVSGLGERYGNVSSNICSITKVVAPIGALITTHFAGAAGPLFVPAAFSLGIAAITIAGMDYVGYGVLHSVQGVADLMRQIEIEPRANTASGR